MRFVKIAIAGLVTAVGLLFSVLFAAGVAVIGLLAYLYLRLRGRPASVRFGTTPRPSQPAATGEVIDVTATEIPARRLEK